MAFQIARPLIFGLLGVVIGFALHDLLDARRAASDANHGAGQECEFDWLRMRGELHAVVRDTLTTTLRAEAQRHGSAAGGLVALAPTGDGGTAKVVSQAAASSAQESALREHAALLAAAEQRGSWSDRDVLQSRQLLGAMSPESRAQAMSAVAAAINGGRFKVTAARPF